MERGVARSGKQDIAYAVEGSGDRTVLLITGLGWRSADWGRTFPGRLAERYRVVRMDNRGTGRSPVSSDPFSLEDMAADAVAVLDAVEAETASVVGISMGGMITQLLLLDHAPRVERAVLMATHFGGAGIVPPTRDALRLFDPMEFIARGRDPVAMMRYQLEVICSPTALAERPEILELMLENARAEPTPPNAFLGQVQAILGSERGHRLGDVERPTLVVHGEEDPLIPPENGRMLAERIPGARLAMLADCGHAPPLEAPERSAELVLEFLGEDAGGAATGN